MKTILFDLVHPAHVHLFKNLILELKKQNHTVIVSSRKKDVTTQLLNHYGIQSFELSKARGGPAGLLGELIQRDLEIFKLHRRYGFQLALGTSASIAHLSAVSKVRSFVFEEDDDHIIPLFAALTYPFATGIVVPSGLRFKKWRRKRIIHDSFHELAYLHPEVFRPEKKILEKYDLRPEQYILFRFSALKAHHDSKAKGFDGGVVQRVQEILKDYPIITSRESQERQKIAPWDMHHVLAFSKLLISDSQTMSLEAACLGVPSVRYNSFVGRISCLEDLEVKYALTYGFRPGDEERMYRKIEELLKIDNLEELWAEKRHALLNDKMNLSRWMSDFISAQI